MLAFYVGLQHTSNCRNFYTMLKTLDPPTPLALWIGGGTLLWLLYSVVFLLTDPAGPRLVVDALANVLPLVALAALTHRIIGTQLRQASVIRQAQLHTLFAPLFALTWYALVIVLLGLVAGLRGNGFEPEGFSGPAATWQIFQGLILYALVAAVCYAIRGGRNAAQVTIIDPRPARMDRYLIRAEDGLRPIETADIVSLTGAQDYSEVLTTSGTHLVRMSLGEFERRLDPAQFVRVHRSAIISLKHLRLAESSGGGRMTARMSHGADVSVSRQGATLLRNWLA